MDDIIKYFPEKIQLIFLAEINKNKEIELEIEEIRIRVSKPIILKLSKKEIIINYYVNSEEILNILQLICENSIYSYQNQIAEGFITIRGGHRVGITGSCVIQNGKVININYINSLNFRISKQVFGASRNILKYILDEKNNSIFNTLIVSPPRIWKNNNFKRFSKTYFKWNKGNGF